jgi:hypothetical protein
MPTMDAEGKGGPGRFVLQAMRESPQEMIITTERNSRHLTTGDLVQDVSVFQPSSRRGSLLERSVNGNAWAESETPVVAAVVLGVVAPVVLGVVAPVVLGVVAPVVLRVAAPVVLGVAARLHPEEVSLQLECPPPHHLK